MSILKQARLIEGEKNGKWVYYRLAENAPLIAAEAIEWAIKHLVSETVIKRDGKILKAIIKQHPVETCKKQKETRAAIVVGAGTVKAKASA
jgi:DNA-binding transcriptional ArsR family regulator